MRDSRGLRWNLVVLALMLLAGGCEGSREYYEELLAEREPEVDPRQAFPALTPFPADSASSGPNGGGPWSFAPCKGWEGNDGRLRLGGLFTAELPPGDGWARKESSWATILVRYPSSSSLPTAYLYAEKIGGAGPDGGIQVFFERVDQRFELFDIPDLSKLMPSFSGSVDKSAAEVAGEEAPPDAVGAAASPPPAAPDASREKIDAAGAGAVETEATGTEAVDAEASKKEAAGGSVDGDAVKGGPVEDDLDAASEMAAETIEISPAGYSSQENSFSGWKWLGTCTASETSEAAAETGNPAPDVSRPLKPFLRLGRSQGMWRLQPGAEPVPAFQILATITLPDRRDYGFHLAIVCVSVPHCEDAPALARLLGSLRVVSVVGDGGGDGWGGEALRELAGEVGISLPEAHGQ